MHRAISTIYIIFMGCQLFAQPDSISSANHLIYLEIAGPGGFGSINYEQLIFSKKNFKMAIRGGVSTNHMNDYTTTFNPDLILPIAINGYYGKNHHLEISLGQTITNIVHADLLTSESKRQTQFFTIFLIGYRYQKSAGGLFFRCVYSPFTEFNSYYLQKSGIALGFAF